MRNRVVLLVFMMSLFAGCMIRGDGSSRGLGGPTPFQVLKSAEAEHRHAGGEIDLGRVLTLYYKAGMIEADQKYHPYLLELTDVLKTPLRKNYRLVLKGFFDMSGPVEIKRQRCQKRVEWLKTLLVKTYYMKGQRITVEVQGDAEPAPPKEGGEGGNPRVEIHVHGDITEAVRFLESKEEKR